MSAVGLAALGELKCLRNLWLYCPHPIGAGLAYLGGMMQLEELGLSGISNLQVRNLAFLQGLGNLRTLHITDNDVTDPVLFLLGGLVNLTSLDLRGTQIGDAGTRQLAGLRGLRLLDLSNTQIGTAAVRACLPLVNLEELNLRHTLVDNTAVLYLQQFPKLEKLVLFDTHISRVGLDELREALPNCQVFG